MAAKADIAAPPSSSSARQLVVIRVAYQGTGHPGPLLTERCGSLVARLREVEPVVKDRTACAGEVRIRLRTHDAQRTVERAWPFVNALGLAARTTIHIDDGKAER